MASVAKSAHDWEGSVCAIAPLSNSAGSGNPQLETVDSPSSAETEVRAQGEADDRDPECVPFSFICPLFLCVVNLSKRKHLSLHP